MRMSVVLACTLWFWLAFSGEARAQRSYFRLYDQSEGLNAGEIHALAQDDQGFLWLGTDRGVLRFDGRNFESWDRDAVDDLVEQVIHGPDDELLVRVADRRALRRTTRGLEPVAGPDGTPLRTLTAFDFDAQGELWAVIDAKVWRRDRSQRWQPVELPLSPGETPARLQPLGNGVALFTDQAAWQLHRAREPKELLRKPDLWLAAGGEGGPLWLATHYFTGLWRLDADGAHEAMRPSGRSLDMRARGDTIWLAIDRYLVAIEADGRMRQIGLKEGLPSGGPLLVDQDESLWLGTFVGLAHFPEPDTRQWTESEGLPSGHAYRLAEADGNIWVSTWAGGMILDAATGEPVPLDANDQHFGWPCDAGPLGVWATYHGRLSAWREGRFAAMSAPFADPETMIDTCTADPTGALWFVTSEGLFVLAPTATTVRKVQMEPDAPVDVMWFDEQGLAYVGNAREICRLTIANDVVRRERCTPIATWVKLYSVARIGPHRYWIGTHGGLFEFDGERATRLAGNRLIEGGSIWTLSRARDEGWWAAGPGVLLRVRPCEGCAAGWETLEAPRGWQGLPGNEARYALESTSGDLWIAGERGVWFVPNSARSVPRHPPRIVPVRARTRSGSHVVGQPLDLALGERDIALEFGALSFRDRSMLRFRSRLAGHDDWSAALGDPVQQFTALAPGAYRAEMAASLDGVRWSDPPAAVEFHVAPFWYETVWARASFLFAALALTAWIYRLRVTALLRVERERTRIAMDLHDELGTGLGSIGMLAGVAASSGTDADERSRLAGEIAGVAGLLGGNLRSLVWSLRSERAGIAELGAQIADHARRLFPREEPHLHLHLPVDAARSALAPELRRHVLLLALEALHNVARHAQASRVTLRLDAGGDDGFQLSIEDDGCGFDAASSPAGTGLESMRRRAAAIGASLRIESAAGCGTGVTLKFGGKRRRRLA